MLSKRSKYAIKALLALADHEREEPVRIADLAREEQIPPKFLELILLGLKNQASCRAGRGRAGDTSSPAIQPTSTWARSSGCSMARSPRCPVPARPPTCACADCPDEAVCGVHLAMKAVRDATAKVLDGTSIASLRRQMADVTHLIPTD